MLEHISEEIRENFDPKLRKLNDMINRLTFTGAVADFPWGFFCRIQAIFLKFQQSTIVMKWYEAYKS